MNAIHFIAAISNKKWEHSKNVDVPLSSWHADDLRTNALPSTRFQSPSVILQENVVVLDVLYILSVHCKPHLFRIFKELCSIMTTSCPTPLSALIHDLTIPSP